jgi:hypothetical protein
VIEFLSHLHLLIAVSPMLAVGFLACGAGFLYTFYERRALERARRTAGGKGSDHASLDKPKAARA